MFVLNDAYFQIITNIRLWLADEENTHTTRIKTSVDVKQLWLADEENTHTTEREQYDAYKQLWLADEENTHTTNNNPLNIDY